MANIDTVEKQNALGKWETTKYVITYWSPKKKVCTIEFPVTLENREDQRYIAYMIALVLNQRKIDVAPKIEYIPEGVDAIAEMLKDNLLVSGDMAHDQHISHQSASAIIEQQIITKFQLATIEDK